ncbi:MAG: DICT sensory domain-containing protein, partial [Thermostichales cyanobacterium BF4_bins_65]
MTGSRSSLLQDLLAAMPHLRPQMYFKSSLVALSHAIEDQVLSEQGSPVVFASFQKERYYQQEAHRYERIARVARQVFVLAVPETRFALGTTPYERIALDHGDPLAQEWHVIAVDPSYSLCLIAREKPTSQRPDHARQFEGIWSFDRRIALQAASLLIPKIIAYRPDLELPLSQLQSQWQLGTGPGAVDPSPFTERLITYIQVGQYKLQRAYQALERRESQERLLNEITRCLHSNADLMANLQTALQLLGSRLGCSRCLFYSYQPDRETLPIQGEYTLPDSPSLLGRPWPVKNHPWIQAVVTTRQMQYCADTRSDAQPHLWQPWQIGAWIGIPIVFQERLLGILEIHSSSPTAHWGQWQEFLQRLAAHLALALMQAEAYQQLQDLNQQLAALDQAKSDLIAVTGHELRTPLSTIQVCLESLAADPEMPAAVRQEMLDTALQDAERLRRLVQDFL